MTSDTFRKLALEIPTAVENAHMSHPDFRVAGNVFASLGYPDENWGMVKLTPEQQGSFIKKTPAVFRACPGAWGKQGCTNVHLASAKSGELRLALKAAATNVLSRAKKKMA